MTKRILIIQADGLLARSLADQLTGQGYGVVVAASAEQACARLAADPADLVLLDVPACGAAAAEACRSLKDCVPCPIVVLGASRAAEAGLRAAGANACLAKPYRLGALLQCLQDQVKAAAAGGELPIGNFRLHPVARHLVDASGRRIHLTEKEAAILTYLHRAGSRVVPRDELLGEVWGYSRAVSTHTVETHIYRLRRKLADGSSVLSTTDGGYRLVG